MGRHCLPDLHNTYQTKNALKFLLDFVNYYFTSSHGSCRSGAKLSIAPIGDSSRTPRKQLEAIFRGAHREVNL